MAVHAVSAVRVLRAQLSLARAPPGPLRVERADRPHDILVSESVLFARGAGHTGGREGDRAGEHGSRGFVVWKAMRGGGESFSLVFDPVSLSLGFMPLFSPFAVERKIQFWF